MTRATKDDERRDSQANTAAPVSVWAPFKQLMALTSALAVVAVAAALAWLYATGAPVRWELYLAVTVGVAGTLLLTGALMGLVFVSSRSGHDESIDRRDRPE